MILTHEEIDVLNNLARRIAEANKAKGFTHATGAETSMEAQERRMLLTIGEVIEAHNELREGHTVQEVYYGPDGKPEGFAVEIVDSIIRDFDLLGRIGVLTGKLMAEKLAYNATRPHKHGKAF